MRHGIWWTGLFAVLATLLTTGKAWVDDEKKAKGAQGEDPKEVKQAVKKKRVIAVEQAGEKKVSEIELKTDGQKTRKGDQASDAEADVLRRRIAVLEAQIRELRALLEKQQDNKARLRVILEEERAKAAGAARTPGQTEGFKSTVTVISRPAVRYYYAYPSCGYYYYYPAVSYYYPVYYYPSWPCWCGW